MSESATKPFVKPSNPPCPWNGASILRLFHVAPRPKCAIALQVDVQEARPAHTLDKIHADIIALEKETDGLLDEILGRRLLNE